MIIEFIMNFFEFDSLNLLKSKKGGNSMVLSERCCKSLKSVDKDIQKIKDDYVVDSALNGVNLFKIL